MEILKNVSAPITLLEIKSFIILAVLRQNV